MLKLYDKVIIKKTGNHGNIIEIDDDNGTKPPIYLVEIVDDEKPVGAEITDVVFWCESEDIDGNLSRNKEVRHGKR